LTPYFADDIRLLERVTGQNFGDWLSTARDTREQVAARLDTVA
jgi:hypothetical protein